MLCQALKRIKLTYDYLKHFKGFFKIQIEYNKRGEKNEHKN